MKALVCLSLVIVLIPMSGFSQNQNNENIGLRIMNCARELNLVHPNEKDTCFYLAKYSESDYVLHEDHTPSCGGDPEVSPARATFVYINNELYSVDSVSLLETKCAVK